jgi:hypothetical protein
MAKFARIVSVQDKLKEYRKFILKFLSRKKIRKMAKNAPKRGHSVRNGNTPSCYCKFGKKPYKYTFAGAYTKVGGNSSDSKYSQQNQRR